MVIADGKQNLPFVVVELQNQCVAR
jgi:hypothetical protein